MLVRILIAALIGVAAWFVAGLVTDEQKARIIGVVVGILAFLLGWGLGG